MYHWNFAPVLATKADTDTYAPYRNTADANI
jgi:hypothetical protein